MITLCRTLLFLAFLLILEPEQIFSQPADKGKGSSQAKLDELNAEIYDMMLGMGLKSNIQLIDKIEEKSLSLSNDNALYMAYQQKIRYYLDMEDKDRLYHYNALAKTMHDKIKPKEEYSGELPIMAWEIQQGGGELVIYKLKEILDQHKDSPHNLTVYSLLGRVYLYSNRQEEALKVFENGLKLAKKRELPAEVMNEVHIMHYYYEISHAAADMANASLALSSCNAIDSILENKFKKQYSAFRGIIYQYKLINQIEFSRAYLEMNDLNSARESLNKVNLLINDDTFDKYKYLYYFIEAQYYYFTKDYDKALEFINPAIAYNTKDRNLYFYLKMNEFRVRILQAMNNLSEAYKTISELYNFRDSIASANLIAQVSELRTIYEVEKIEMEVEKEKAKSAYIRSILIATLIVAILLVILTLILRRNTLTLKEKNKKLYAQYKKIESILKIPKGTKSLSSSKEEDSDNPQKQLYLKIEEHLEQTKDFKNSNLSRETLALKIGTNGRYLIEAIRYGSNKTFTDYINDLRLDYAANKLTENRTEPVEHILIESGFSSRATFNRLFKNKFGMTPKELRALRED